MVPRFKKLTERVLPDRNKSLFFHHVLKASQHRYGWHVNCSKKNQNNGNCYRQLKGPYSYPTDLTGT